MGGQSTWRRTCSMVTLSTTDSTRIGQELTWASMVRLITNHVAVQVFL